MCELPVQLTQQQQDDRMVGKLMMKQMIKDFVSWVAEHCVQYLQKILLSQ